VLLMRVFDKDTAPVVLLRVAVGESATPEARSVLFNDADTST